MNLLVTRHDKIGDFVVTLPLIKAIKEQYPLTKVSVLVSKINVNFAKEIEFIDEVIVYDKDNFFATLHQLRKRKFDSSISAFIDIKMGLMLFLAGIKQRIAPATKIAQIFFNKRVTQRRSRVEKTEWQYNLDLAIEIFPNIKLEFSKPIINTKQIKELADVKKVAFHAGYGGSSEGNLTLDDYIKLAYTLSKINVEVIFTFGPDDKATFEYVKEHLHFKATLVDSKMSLMEFCKFLSGLDIFVSTSTGPMHLAGAVNIKTVSFFGGSLFSSPKRWASVSEQTNQHNFVVPQNYDEIFYKSVEKEIIALLNEK